MMRLKSDLVPALIACADGGLKHFDLRWSNEAALTVVMAAKGYPDAYPKGSEIRGLDAAAQGRGRRRSSMPAPSARRQAASWPMAAGC